jgi:hypothetical protein
MLVCSSCQIRGIRTCLHIAISGGCSDCGSELSLLDAFPSDRCLDCHAIAVKDEPLPTAQELARMWGGR